VKLFSRDRRQIEITESGIAFLNRTESILHLLEEARSELASLRKGEKGCVHIGFLPYTTGPFLFSLIDGFRQEHPGIQVVLHDMSPVDMHKALLDGSIEIGLNREIPDRALDQLEIHRLYADRLVAVLPVDHPLAGEERISLRELREEAFAICKRAFATPLFDATIQACADQGFAPRIATEAVTPHGAVFAVAGGSVVGISFSAMRFFFSEGISFVPLRQETPRLNLTLEKRHGTLSRAGGLFHEFVRDNRAIVENALGTGADHGLSLIHRFGKV
jgi:DNA-binding transcriptional LysR family regulator